MYKLITKKETYYISSDVSESRQFETAVAETSLDILQIDCGCL